VRPEASFGQKEGIAVVCIKLRYTAAATHKPALIRVEVIATVLGMLVLMPTLVTASSISRAEQARAFLVDLQTPNNEQAQVHDRELKHKEAIEREIKGGEAHTYRVTLNCSMQSIAGKRS
jgi:hypothetical protein